MTSDERHRRMDSARTRAELSVQDLWLRYVALGGTGDAFDLDGYLQGLVPLKTFEQDVLAQALNEALQESYRAYFIPLSMPPSNHHPGSERLGHLIDDLLDDRPAPSPTESELPGVGPA
jgi:hypothetical protein